MVLTKINDDAIIILNSSKGAKEENSWHLFLYLDWNENIKIKRME